MFWKLLLKFEVIKEVLNEEKYYLCIKDFTLYDINSPEMNI